MADETTPTVRLAGGAEMPVLGLGTWQLTGDDAVQGTRHALELGYRLIDTAVDYENQEQIGEGLRASDIDREDVFLVSKVEEDEDTYAATGERVEQLGIEQLDLCLIHRPPPSGAGEELWDGLIRARREGLTREIGVSNYSPEQVDRLIEVSGERPAVNQIEWSPFGHSDQVMEHANRHGVVIQAYSPLTRTERLGDDRLAEIGDRHGRTAAQVMLRWSVQVGAPPVPKAATASHREENLAVFDFELSETEMEALGQLNEHYSSLAGLQYI
jgi:2,5-diketo-D-gluconate reductase A